MDTSSCGLGGRRSLTKLSKLNNKTNAGCVKDVNENGRSWSGGEAASSELKGNPQPVITDFLMKGAEGTGTAEPQLLPSPPQESSNIYRIVSGGSNNGTLGSDQSGANPVITPVQMEEMQNMVENQPIELLEVMEGADSAGVINDIGETHPEYKKDQEGNFADILTEPNRTRASRNLNPVIQELLITEEQDAEPRQSEGVGKVVGWSNEGRGKFYSLTEDSDGNSSDGVQSDAEDNLSSELETSLSSAIGPTIKQLQRQNKHTKRQSGTAAAEVIVAEHSAAALKWYYSGIILCTPEKALNTCPTRNNGRGGSGEDVSKVHSEETILQLIYGRIQELQTETRADSRRARFATKQLQVTVSKVAKSCERLKKN
ncbi:hypothetical protein NDU88_000463 [Pleurodeles waltl]|uniref:Uncharacterized protein n=1 Tax=Pleurodeles waltl TaxID=8319 RepID=A0AAV7S4M7_PLEWA|nr:hypothetical protein NDU88_000463 [Pleurodeles waltl]